MYWATALKAHSQFGIGRVKLDGSEFEELWYEFPAGEGEDHGLDYFDGRIYFTRARSESDADGVGRVVTDGSNPEPDWLPSTHETRGGSRGIVFHGPFIYWARSTLGEPEEASIARAEWAVI